MRECQISTKAASRSVTAAALPRLQRHDGQGVLYSVEAPPSHLTSSNLAMELLVVCAIRITCRTF